MSQSPLQEAAHVARPRRIHIVGSTSVGKTTLARQLATALHCPHVELDALHWMANWQPAPPDEFAARIQAALAGDCWVVDGNYRKAIQPVRERVQLVVWLDYPLWLIYWRLLRRTVRRIVTRERLWESGNRESLRTMLLSRDSLFIWAAQTYGRRRRDYGTLLSQPELRHFAMVRLGSPAETDRWRRAFLGEAADPSHGQ